MKMAVPPSSSTHPPVWLDSLLSEKFFNACLLHEDAKKNEKNIFCLDCSEGICSHCVASHSSHRLLQIRRYVYHNVIRHEDAEKLMDCSYVQTYINNGAKVVFLNPRPPVTRPFRASTNGCITCDRALQERFLFCCISCKINEIMRSDANMMSEYLYDCEVLALNELDDGLITPDSVLESLRTSSGSSASGGGAAVDCRTLACTATTEVVRKKRSSKSAVRPAVYMPISTRTPEDPPILPPEFENPPMPSPASENSAANRRKSMPHRSPFH